MNFRPKTTSLPVIAGFKFFVFLSVALLLALNTSSNNVSATVNDESNFVETARSADDLVNSIGVNTHLHFGNDYGDFPMVKERLVNLGVRHIRDAAHLSKDTVTMWRNYGRYRELAEAGIKSTLIVDPRGDGDGRMREIDSSKIEEMIYWVGDSTIEAFEGPNEYDISGDWDWIPVLTNYQKSLYEAVKNNSSTANTPVVGPTLVYNEHYYRLGDISAYMDYTNVHPFPSGRMPTNWLMSNIQFASIIGGTRPVMATETGYNNALNAWNEYDQAVSESVSGKYVSRLVFEYLNHGFARTFLFQFLDGGPDPDKIYTESNFGLVRHGGSVKPAYTALQNIISVLNDPGPGFEPGSLSYSIKSPSSSIHHTLLQKRDGRFYLVLWQEVSSWDNNSRSEIDVPAQQVTVNLNTQITSANTYLPFYSASAINSYDYPQQLTVDVPDHVLIIELTPAQ